MDSVHKLQHSTSTGTYSGTGIGTGDGTCIGISKYIGDGTSTCSGIGTSIGIGSGIGVGTQDVDYCLPIDEMVKFRDTIYVSNNSELKKMMLREFHVKPYISYPGYHMTLTIVKRFYFWLN